MANNQYFTVKSDISKSDSLSAIQQALERLESEEYKCATGSAVFSQDFDRYIIPTKLSSLKKVTVLRVKILLKYLLDSGISHTTVRDVWYGVTTTKYGLFDPKMCLDCFSRNTESFDKDTGRKRKTDNTKVFLKMKRCLKCGFEYTDFVDPYKTLMDDIKRAERLTGIEKESLGIHSGQKGFLYGSERMQAYSPARQYLIFNTRPSIMYDLPSLKELSGFSKIILLEKESFVSHIVPIKSDKPNFAFINCIDTAIITSQGYEGKYNKAFVANCVKSGISPFSLHDADGDGVDMDIILKHHSQSSAHWKDELAVNAHRMGFFPSIGLAVQSPSTPMSKIHIGNLETQVERLEEINDDLYSEELQILLDRGVRWELQSMGALDKTAGQAYIIEYLRNRNIPVKPTPNLERVQKSMFESYSKAMILENLEETINEEINSFANSIIDRIKSILRASLKDKVEKAIEDLDDFPDELPDNENIVQIFKEKLARNIEYTSRSVEQWVANDFCDIKTSAQINGSVNRKENIITIKIDSMAIEASRTFKELEPVSWDEINLYDQVISHCEINSSVCKTFREALETKFENYEPESDPDIEDLSYEPEKEFDDFKIDEYKYQEEKTIKCPTCNTITTGLADSDNDIKCKDCDTYRRVDEYGIEITEEDLEEPDEILRSAMKIYKCPNCEKIICTSQEPDSDNDIQCPSNECDYYFNAEENTYKLPTKAEIKENAFKKTVKLMVEADVKADQYFDEDYYSDDEWAEIENLALVKDEKESEDSD